jgi:hypothetical protein
MSEDAKSQVIANIKEANCFVVQLDKSTDSTGKSQLLAFSRSACNRDIEKFLFCKPLPETTKPIFLMLSRVISVLSWESCISIESAPSMSGSLKGFVVLVKRKNPGIISTHCFLHRETFNSKSVVPQVRKILHEMIKMMNYVKNRPLESRLFSAPRPATEAAHKQILLHMEVRWLLRAGAFKVL